MKITIQSCDTGYILSYSGGKEVFEGNEEADAQALQRCLQSAILAFGYNTSRYGKENLYVEIRPGDKYMSPEDLEAATSESTSTE